MGVYVRYKNETVKIGDEQDLYLVSFQKYQQALKNGLLSQIPGNPSPEIYTRHSSGFRFRFPFPDEDKLPFGSIGDFPEHRAIVLKINPGTDTRFEEQLKVLAGKDGRLEITQQKLVYMSLRCKFSLVLVIRNPESGNSFRIEDEEFITKLNKTIIINHVLKETDHKKKTFYCSVIEKILQGYNREIPVRLTIYSRKKNKVPQKRSRLI